MRAAQRIPPSFYTTLLGDMLDTLKPANDADRCGDTPVNIRYWRRDSTAEPKRKRGTLGPLPLAKRGLATLRLGIRRALCDAPSLLRCHQNS
jgi:hypothetical protein